MPANAEVFSPDSPRGVVQRYLAIVREPVSIERHRHLIDVLTPECHWFVETTGAGLHEDVPESAKLEEQPGTTSERAIVVAGTSRFDLQKTDGKWRVDRRLAESWTDFLGVRMRLPTGLVASSAANTWERGGVKLRAWRAPHVSKEELMRVAGAEVGNAPEVGAYVEECAIGGRHVLQAYSRGDAANCSLTIVDDGAKEPLWLALRCPSRMWERADPLLLCVASIERAMAADEPIVHGARPALRERRLDEGFTILTAGPESADEVECTNRSCTDLDELVAASGETRGKKLSEVRVPGTLLPARILYRIPPPDHRTGDRFLLKALGVLDGRGVVLAISTPAVSADGGAELLRLNAMVESLKPLPADTLWPDGARGTIKRPAGWRQPPGSDFTKISWCGFGGDSIELLVGFESETILGGEKIAVVKLRDKRVLTVVAYSSSEERLRRVVQVAKACVETLEVTNKR